MRLDPASLSGQGAAKELLLKHAAERTVSAIKLLTQELLRAIPPLYTSENETDPLVICKFFTPDAHWTWYVIEGATREREGCGWGTNCNHKPLSAYDPSTDDVLFYGFVIGDFPELGYFTLAELTLVRGVSGLPVERDRSFTPCRLSVVTQ